MKLLVDGCGGAIVGDYVNGNAVGETVEMFGSGVLVEIVTDPRDDGLRLYTVPPAVTGGMTGVEVG